ncbi:hypothetical protein EDD86DRAFT_250507 [Gorgonomyces haynaldii]|nr:hypothetical protein EDD86DRAFT_250507 [Gorgonomyces haynaldii]
MLIRLKTFGGWRTRSFISMLILAAIHGILCLPNAYYGFIINGTPSILILITCIMNIAASFLFVHHLAQSLNVPFKKMVYNVLFKHEGCRWILLTLVHVFLVVGVVIAIE